MDEKNPTGSPMTRTASRNKENNPFSEQENTATKLNAARPEVRKNIRVIPQCSGRAPGVEGDTKKRSERERSCALLVDKREGKPLGDKEGRFGSSSWTKNEWRGGCDR